jgi:hypothetical protein
MRFSRVALLMSAIVLCVPPAVAAELPTRKPGLWEVKMISDNRAPLIVQQCVDEATDQMLLQSAGPISVAACTKRDVQQSADGLTVDSTCKVDGKPATARAVITGSLDSAYTMNVTSTGEGVQAGLTMTLTGKWIGPCPSDQKPGDVIMPGGVKVNIPEMQKRAPAPTGMFR